MDLGGIPISPDMLRDVAQHGSPLVLGVVGRSLGLGPPEQAALARGGLPWWLLLGGGLIAGVAVGAYVHKRWPEALPETMR